MRAWDSRASASGPECPEQGEAQEAPHGCCGQQSHLAAPALRAGCGEAASLAWGGDSAQVSRRSTGAFPGADGSRRQGGGSWGAGRDAGQPPAGGRAGRPAAACGGGDRRGPRHERHASAARQAKGGGGSGRTLTQERHQRAGESDSSSGRSGLGGQKAQGDGPGPLGDVAAFLPFGHPNVS